MEADMNVEVKSILDFMINQLEYEEELNNSKEGWRRHFELHTIETKLPSKSEVKANFCGKEFCDVVNEEYDEYSKYTKKFPLSTLGFLMAGSMAVLTALISVALTKTQDATTSTFKHFILDYDFSLALLFIIEPAGYVLIVVAINYFFFGCAGSGIPLAMTVLEELSVEQTALEGLDIPFLHDTIHHRAYIDYIFGFKIKEVLGIRILLGKFGLTIVGLLIGASIGIEGPTVQISSCVFYEMSKIYLKYSRPVREAIFKTPRTRILFVKGIACAGGAAGIAAAFNSPLGGILFAMEEMGSNFELRSHKLVFIAVCISGLVSFAFLGGYTYFGSTTQGYDTISAPYVVTALFAMILGGLLGSLWGVGMILGMKLKKRITVISQRPYTIAFVMGILYASISYITDGEILLSGYSNVRVVLNDNQAYCNADLSERNNFEKMSPTYGLAKSIATYFSYWSGISGGLFSPALAAGAGWGQMFYCEILFKIYPDISSSIVTLLVMQGYFSGVTQSPLTAYAILTATVETGGSATAIHFTMLTVSIGAALFSKLFMRESLYEALAGLGLPKVPSECRAPSMLILRQIEGNNRIKHADLQFV